RGGCAPLGGKKAYPVFMDETALLWERIFLSAGQRGVQLELSPEDAARACGAVFADLTRA
ncbi:MAG: Cys-tRNA(Pro) deacylase, partial [Desulfovibrio sp.]|nr:Cys-tRNA(Pro) deacylase [Desulfovibrio sp.]